MATKPKSYDTLIDSKAWESKLRSLNTALADALSKASAPLVLNGNLFYDHLAEGFTELPLTPQFEMKRRNFFALAQRSEHLFEIGVNGGHSLLLALMANPKLKVVGVDICQQLAPEWARVDVYVPAAFKWLEETFPGRVETITGNSLIEAPRYALDHPDAQIDLLHLDGAKDTHLREVLALAGVMPSGALIVHDDMNMKVVKRADRQLRKINVTKPVDYAALGLIEDRFHVIRARS